MDAFHQQLQSERKPAIIEKEQELHLYTNVTMDLDEDQEDTKEIVLTSPTTQANVHLDSFDATPMHSLMKPSELVTPFGQRKYKFVVHSTFNTLPTVHEIEKKMEERIMKMM